MLSFRGKNTKAKSFKLNLYLEIINETFTFACQRKFDSNCFEFL